MNETLSEKLITISGEYTFRVGEMFSSYEELEKRLELHCSESLVYYWRRDTRKKFLKSCRFKARLTTFLYS